MLCMLKWEMDWTKAAAVRWEKGVDVIKMHIFLKRKNIHMSWVGSAEALGVMKDVINRSALYVWKNVESEKERETRYLKRYTWGMGGVWERMKPRTSLITRAAEEVLRERSTC